MVAVLVGGWFVYQASSGEEDGTQQESQAETETSSFGGEAVAKNNGGIEVYNPELDESMELFITEETDFYDSLTFETGSIDDIQAGADVNIHYDTRTQEALEVWF